jgi:serine/threonine protein kinase
VTTQDSQHSQQSVQDTGARTIKEKAGERLGQWIKGKYRIDQLLGVGGMAAVYAATHRNGSRIALKILHTEFARDESVKGRFLREGYVANKVDHPGRVAILDDDETELGESFLVMELLEGETLQQLWKRFKRKVPVNEALRIAEAVLDTLGPFHEQNVVHRDLKPANIFITNAQQVKLLDFGVAQLRESGGEAMTRAGTALGTPSYMSPEQAMGKSDALDGRSDVFAMGATLYAILSGKRLHHGKSDNEAFILAATQPAPSIARSAPELSVDVIALVDKALQWDRRNRFQSAHEMRDECRRVMQSLGGTPARAPAPPPSPPPPAPADAPQRPFRGTLAYGEPSPLAQAPPIPVRAPRRETMDARGSEPPAPDAIIRTPAPAPGTPSLREPPGEQLRKTRTAAIDLGQGERPSRMPGADEEDPFAKIKEVFDRLERATPSFRQYTLNHPESKGRIRAIHRTVTDAMRDNPDGFAWIVHPFCFTSRLPDSDEDVPIWEPSAPNDAIPYNLCAAGIEEMSIEPGITEDELGLLLRAMIMDATSDGMNADIKRTLWESGFKHIKYKAFEELAADGDEEKSLTEVHHLESMAREDLREVAAMAVSTDQSGLDAVTASAALELTPAERTALGARLSLDPEGWRRRFLDLTGEAYADCESRGDTALLLAPLAEYAHHFVGKAHYKELFELYFWLVERVQKLAQIPLAERLRAPAMPRELTTASLTRGLFPPDIMRQLLRALLNESLPAGERDPLFNGVRAVLGSIDAGWFDDALTNANMLQDGEALELVMAYIERHVQGRESMVIQRLDLFRPALAQRFLALVTATRSPQAIALLKPLLNSRNPALRCEAAALLTPSDEQLGKLLVEWLESNDPKLRMAALTTMTHHHVRTAGPGLVRQIEAFESFTKRPAEEQRQVFETLYALNPSRAEAVLVKVLDQHGLMSDAVVDRTRSLAAESLGKHADGDRPIEALENAARRRPWNTPELRKAAGKAVEAVLARLGRAYTNKELD